MQNNGIGLLPHTTYENELRLNQTTMSKREPKLQNSWKEMRCELSWSWTNQAFLRHYRKAGLITTSGSQCGLCLSVHFNSQSQNCVPCQESLGSKGVVYAFPSLVARREFWSQGPMSIREYDTVVFPLCEQSISTWCLAGLCVYICVCASMPRGRVLLLLTGNRCLLPNSDRCITAIELYPLKGWILLYANYISIKLLQRDVIEMVKWKR